MVSSSNYLGVILVIAAIIIAHFAWCRWKVHHNTSKFSYTAPAPPCTQESIISLFAALKQMVVLGQSFEKQAAATGASPEYITSARRSASYLVQSLDRAEKKLSDTPSTYAGHLAIYRGLLSTDATLLIAADAYAEAGRRLQSSSGEEVSLSDTLTSMGGQLRLVVRAVHGLGAALDLE